jgi:DNA-directed RNA polymerase specialized sigma24 family protein
MPEKRRFQARLTVTAPRALDRALALHREHLSWIEAVVARMAQIPPKQVSSSDKDSLANLSADLLSTSLARLSGDDGGEPTDTELSDHLASLCADHRLVLTMRYIDGLGVPEIAGLIGRTTTATYSLLARARDDLRVRAAGERT